MKAYTATKKPRKMIGAFPRDRQLLRDVIAAGRTLNPAVNGLTHVTATQAVRTRDSAEARKRRLRDATPAPAYHVSHAQEL